MYSVVCTTCSKTAPAAFRSLSNFWKMYRVWPTMLSGPTIWPLSSVAVVPEMNRRFPARTAGENVYRSGHGPVAVITSYAAMTISLGLSPRSLLSQEEPPDLARLGLRQLVQEFEQVREPVAEPAELVERVVP